MMRRAELQHDPGRHVQDQFRWTAKRRSWGLARWYAGNTLALRSSVNCSAVAPERALKKAVSHVVVTVGLARHLGEGDLHRDLGDSRQMEGMEGAEVLHVTT